MPAESPHLNTTERLIMEGKHGALQNLSPEWEKPVAYPNPYNIICWRCWEGGSLPNGDQAVVLGRESPSMGVQKP